ncbi:histidine kinase [Actinomycetospora aeridis]|uniref:histidine kinase n=1 Tax=Actinomycetospora aeridis TaxID=3129231 RepID=A0ABU8NDW3_9PSEU
MPWGRTPSIRSLAGALVALVAVFVVLGLVTTALVVTTPGPTWAYVGLVVVAWVHVAAGVVAWWQRPSNATGGLLVAGGGAWLLADLGNTGVPALAAVGSVTATTPVAVLVQLLLAFPSGRVRDPAARVVVGAAWVTVLVLQAPEYLFTPQPPPHQLLAIADRPDLAAVGGTVQRVVGALVVVATVVLVVRRLRATDRERRRVLLPLAAYGVVAAVMVPLGAAVADLVGLDPVTLGVVQIVALAGVPVAFVTGLLRGGFARTGEVEELAAWLGGADGRPGLARACARALGDPTAQVVFWLPGPGHYVDAAGAPAPLPGAGSGRAAVEVELRGRRVGAIAYDATLLADPEPVAAAGRVLALAIDRERLLAELRASDAALRRSRQRLVEAADGERRRIARDLHDGLQVRLVLLALDAQRLADDAGPALRERAVALRTGIDDAATELRGHVHAVMPAALVERGLAAATEDLVDRVPLPTRLELALEDGTLPPAVESTAYFVVAEGLTNALRHAHARALAVRVVAADGSVRVEVSDDGEGGVGGPAGGGMRGLADRVGAVGGSLSVDSPVGGGTTVTVELPCGS